MNNFETGDVISFRNNTLDIILRLMDTKLIEGYYEYNSLHATHDKYYYHNIMLETEEITSLYSKRIIRYE